ncbi:hypothetical protein [Nocardia wallacei]|uniref:hypothetical protein n=1 Tax=Nocardia wallacei TaxID=480035 RepID=UPI0024569FA9|nr:hypothetical protein [Nocardia wallacei]
MSYSPREQERIQRMAARAEITDLYAFAKKEMGDGWWENFNRRTAQEFEMKLVKAADEVQIGEEAARALIDRAAAVGITPEGIASSLGTDAASLHQISHGHVELVDRMIEQASRRRNNGRARGFDHSAQRVADLAGLPAVRKDGRCHYCGLPLNRNGYCEECV